MFILRWIFSALGIMSIHVYEKSGSLTFIEQDKWWKIKLKTASLSKDFYYCTNLLSAHVLYLVDSLGDTIESTFSKSCIKYWYSKLGTKNTTKIINSLLILKFSLVGRS